MFDVPCFYFVLERVDVLLYSISIGETLGFQHRYDIARLIHAYTLINVR